MKYLKRTIYVEDFLFYQLQHMMGNRDV